MTDLLGYHGVHVTPPALDTWLVGQRDGYLPAGRISADAVARYARGQGVDLAFIGGSTGSELQRSQMCQWGPQVIQAKVADPQSTDPLRRFSHWGLASGYTDNNYSNLWMADPAGAVAGKPDYQTGPFSLFTKWGRPASDLAVARTKVFQGPTKAFRDFSGFYVIFHSPVQFVVTDASGRRAGFDVNAGTYLREIPFAEYEDEGAPDFEGLPDSDPSKVLRMPQPPAGEYNITATGTADGTYALDIWTYDRDGALTQMPTLAAVPIRQAESHSYSLSYSPQPGAPAPSISGGFDGGGQRPRDVNRFLRYVSPAASRTALPSGTTSFGLTISYGATTLPGTFSATLNGLDITGLFQPSPGTTEAVRLDLQAGSNVLKLLIDGMAGTRVATDSDRLVLDVP